MPRSHNEQEMRSRQAWLRAVQWLWLLSVFPGFLWAAADWKPEKNVEIVVAANPGGGADAAARAVQRIIQDNRLVAASITVVNKPGGGGAVAFNYISQHEGDGHYLTLGTAPLITSYIVGQTSFTYRDLTPITMLYNEYAIISVKADSTFRTARDLVLQFRRDPDPVTVGVSTSRGNTNHIAVALLMKAAGGEVRKMRAVIFDAGGKAIAALLGGHVQVVPSNASLVIPHVQAGSVRILGIAAPRRLGGLLAAVPTLREQGFDVVVSMACDPGAQGVVSAADGLLGERVCKAGRE